MYQKSKDKIMMSIFRAQFYIHSLGRKNRESKLQTLSMHSEGTHIGETSPEADQQWRMLDTANRKPVKQLLHFNPDDVCQEFAEKSGTMWYWEGWAPKEVSRIIIPGESASSCQSTNQQAEVEKWSVFRKQATRHKEGTLVGWGHQVRTREKKSGPSSFNER